MLRVRDKYPRAKTFTSVNLALFKDTEIFDIYTHLDKHIKPGTHEYEVSIVNISSYILKNYPEIASIDQINEMRSNITKYAKKKHPRKKKEKKKKIQQITKNENTKPITSNVPVTLTDDEIFVVIDNKYKKLRLDQHDISVIANCFDGMRVKNDKIVQSDDILNNILNKFQEMKYFPSFRSFLEEKKHSMIKFGYYIPIYIYSIARACNISTREMVSVKSRNITEGLMKKEIAITMKNNETLQICPLFDDDIFSGNIVVKHNHSQFTARLTRKIGNNGSKAREGKDLT